MNSCHHCGTELTSQAVRELCPSCLLELALTTEMEGPLTGIEVDHYEIEAPIGQGGMGLVYLARDTRLNRAVAIKFLLDAGARKTELIQRFEREAWTASSLNHPNICTIHDIGNYQDHPYIVMEFIEGQTLSDYISESGPPPLKKALDISVQVAEALQTAHSKGIIHRDIKPSNIMVTERGQVKVVDFGLAKDFDDTSTLLTSITSSPRRMLGTIPYMSPEQLSGEEVDYRTDLFALGVVILEMVTGYHPFKKNSTMATIKAILTDPPSFPEKESRHVSRPLRNVLSRLLAKAPHDRYHSAGAAAADLRRLQTVSAPVVRLGSGRRAWPAVLTLLIASAAVLLLLLFLVPQEFIPWFEPAENSLKVVAVLPFYYYAEEGTEEWLADGMTDALISRLATIEGLIVPSTTTMLNYREKSKSLTEIGKELDADALIEGSVQVIDGRLICRVRMVDAQTERHLLGPLEFEEPLNEILQLQTQMARRLAEDIRSQLSPGERSRMAFRQVDPEAYLALLKGRHFLERRSPEALNRSIEFFNEAVELAPHYGEAYAGLADAYLLMGSTGYFDRPSKLVIPKARSAAREALKWDPNLAEAHTSLASIAMSFDWDWKTAERHFKQAIELRPEYPVAHHWYGLYLAARGELGEAEKEVELARTLDPLSAVNGSALARIYYYQRRYPLARREFQNVLALQPEFAPARLGLGLVSLKERDFKEAALQFEKGMPEKFRPLTKLLHEVIKRPEQFAEAESLTFPVQDVSPFYMAVLFSSMAELHPTFETTALEWLEDALAAKSEYLIYIDVDPIFDSVRDHSRFQSLLDRIGL